MKKNPKSETASTKFTKEEKEQINTFLEKESKRRGKKLTMGSFLHEAALQLSDSGNGIIKNSAKSKPTAYDSMKDMIGSISGGPTDLSTNKVYLEDMGKDSI